MRKNITKISVMASALALSYIVTATAYAQPTASDEAAIAKIKKSFENVVARNRNLTDAISGTLTNTTPTSIEITTADGELKKIALDEVITKYYKITGAAQEDITWKDLKVPMYLIVLGGQAQGTLTANIVYTDEKFSVNSGQVMEINTVNNTLKVETVDKNIMFVVLEPSTKMDQVYGTEANLTQTSIVKMKEGDIVHFSYRIADLRQKNDRVTAYKLLHIPISYLTQ